MNLITNLVPDSVLNRIKLAIAYYKDYKRFNDSGFRMNNNNSFENLRARITFHSHALEKGMSNSNLRLGFGKNAFMGLFESMDLYNKLNYPSNDIRFITALSVIENYIILHKQLKFEVSQIEKKFNLLISNSNEIREDVGGFYEFNKEKLTSFKDSKFSLLAENRYSVRDFGEGTVPIDKIEAAIQIATKTPSVCNRQAWKVYIIKNPEMITDVLSFQHGLTGFGNNLDTLLVITCDKQYMGNYTERNQTYVDGGMFSMTLLYALEHQGLATCALNANLFRKPEIEIRKLVNINKTEDIILFIAVGNYPHTFKVAKSNRDNYSMITEYRL